MTQKLMSVFIYYSRYSKGSGTIWLSSVRCTASAVSLSDCLHSGFSSVTNCDHSQDVALMCLKVTVTVKPTNINSECVLMY